jgi:type I restriction enzyme S subunit
MELKENKVKRVEKRGFKTTEVGVIPEDWNVVTLKSVININRGGSPRPIERYISTTPNGVNWIKIGDAEKNGKYIRHTNEKIIPEGVRFSREVRAGDFLLSNSMSFGRPYILEIDGCIHDGWLVLQNYQGTFDKDFLYYNLSSRYTLEQYISKAAGSGVLNLNKVLVGSIQLRVPSTLAEQHAIATALSDVDGLIAGLEGLLAKKHALKQGAMQQLLSGQKRLPGFTGGWGVKRLGEIAETDPENLSGSTRSDYEFKYIALEDVDRGVLLGHSLQRFGSAPSRARRILLKDDVVVSTVRPNLQSHFHFKLDSPDWICSTGFCVVRCDKNKAWPEYVYAHLFHSEITRQIEALVTGSNYPAINRRDVAALTIPMPTVEEQTAIATVLSDMDAELGALEAKLGKTRLLKQGMMQELLTGRTRLV